MLNSVSLEFPKRHANYYPLNSNYRSVVRNKLWSLDLFWQEKRKLMWTINHKIYQFFNVRFAWLFNGQIRVGFTSENFRSMHFCLQWNIFLKDQTRSVRLYVFYFRIQCNVCLKKWWFKCWLGYSMFQFKPKVMIIFFTFNTYPSFEVTKET